MTKTASNENSPVLKTDVNFEKYFQPPSLKDAKRRGKEEVQVHEYTIPEDMKGIGKGRKYLIRTYGCP